MSIVVEPRPQLSSWAVPRPAGSWLTQPTYLMDGECGFCKNTMAKVLRSFPDTFTAVPYQAVSLAEYGLTLEQCSQRGHFLQPAGESVKIMASGQSWAGILQQQPGLWGVLGRSMSRAPLRFATELVYRWVAANRGQLSRLRWFR